MNFFIKIDREKKKIKQEQSETSSRRRGNKSVYTDMQSKPG